MIYYPTKLKEEVIEFLREDYKMLADLNIFSYKNIDIFFEEAFNKSNKLIVQYLTGIKKRQTINLYIIAFYLEGKQQDTLYQFFDAIDKKVKKASCLLKYMQYFCINPKEDLIENKTEEEIKKILDDRYDLFLEEEQKEIEEKLKTNHYIQNIKK